MSTIDQLRTLNPDKTIHSLDEAAFADYGVTYAQYDVSELKAFMDQHVTIPAPSEAISISRQIPTWKGFPSSSKLGAMSTLACQLKQANVPATPTL